MSREHEKLEYCDCDGAGTCNGCTLFMCKVCRGAECDLTTECPGVKITPEQSKAITNGSLDYVGGAWVTYPDHQLEGCCKKCNEGIDHDEHQACQFTKCKVCGVDDSTPYGEYKLRGKCK